MPNLDHGLNHAQRSCYQVTNHSNNRMNESAGPSEGPMGTKRLPNDQSTRLRHVSLTPARLQERKFGKTKIKRRAGTFDRVTHGATGAARHNKNTKLNKWNEQNMLKAISECQSTNISV